MKKIILFVLILSCINFSNSFAQVNEKDKKDDTKKKGFWSKVVFGGNIGLQFGTITLIDISPNVGYLISPRLMAGLGLTYQYYKSNLNYYKITSNIFGIRTFANYTVIDNIGQNLPIKSNFSLYTHVEYEALNLDHDFSVTASINTVKRFWLHGVLVGGGLKQPIGKRSSFNIEILYNLTADSRTPYNNPVIRFGFFF